MNEQLDRAAIHLQWLLECGCEFEYSATKTAICYGVDRQQLVDYFNSKNS